MDRNFSTLNRPCTGDPLSGKITGACTNAGLIDPVLRQRSYYPSVYLAPIQHRSNLTVITDANVQKIVLSGSSPSVVAESVVYVKDDQTTEVRASKEVILAAGAIHSPKLLELSGIGNANLLNGIHIPVYVDNPHVGENLQNHPMTEMSFEVREGVKTVDDLFSQDPLALQDMMEKEEQIWSIGSSQHLLVVFLPLEEIIEEETRSDLHDMIDRLIASSDGDASKQAHAEYVKELLLNPNESTAGFFTYAARGNFGKSSGSGLMTSKFLLGSF